MKKYLPYRLKLAYKLFKRNIADRRNKHLVFAEKMTGNFLGYNFKIETKQVIRKSYLYENKIHNLKIGKRKIEQYIIQPNQTFSFWKILGNPSVKNGFKKGRNIINGILTEDIGGGLCQLSGIIYHTSLMAGLTIEERYNHTVDIYKESERLSPLGTDATVVYGYKDLRVKNNYSFPIHYCFEISNEQISCSIKSTEKIRETTLILDREETSNHRKVTIYSKNKKEVISKSKYLLP